MAWSITGNIQGPIGATGATGPAGPTGPQGATGAIGATGPIGPQGPTGAKGENGVNLDIKGSVATYSLLPGSPVEGDAYLVLSDGKLYFYDGVSWPSDGHGVPFLGPQGPAGPQGSTGPTGATGTVGMTGPAGVNGLNGVRGSKWFVGSGTPSGVGGSAIGDFYLDTITGTIYELS